MDYILREIVKNTQDVGFNDDLLRAADYIVELEQRLAAAEAKNTELEKELFILASDVSFCGFGINAGLLDKAKRIYTRLLKGFGESERGSDE